MKELHKKAWEAKNLTDAAPAIPGFSGKTEKLRSQPVVAGLQRMDSATEVRGSCVKSLWTDSPTQKHTFTAPAKPSLLGLDKLAVEKRKERELEQQIKEEKERKKPRIAAMADDEELLSEVNPEFKAKIKKEEEDYEGNSNVKIKKEPGTTQKHYRGTSNRRIGTPSHAGGVDKEAVSRISEREKDKKDSHLRWDSKDEKKRGQDFGDSFKKPFQRRRMDEEEDEPRIKRGPRIPVPETPRWEDEEKGGGSGTPRRMDTGRRMTSPSRRLSTPSRERVPMDPRDYAGYEREYDREFYKQDEGGYQDNETSVFLGDEEKFKKMEEIIARKQVEQLRIKQNQKNEDNMRWEENRLLLSGVVTERGVQTDFEEEGKRVALLVHDIKPPFLDGRVVYTTQQETISAVKDPTSDMAILSRKGSHVVREQRELKERIKGQNKSWEVAGRRIGDIMGIKKEEGNSYPCLVLNHVLNVFLSSI